jgi:hypothetical protein
MISIIYCTKEHNPKHIEHLKKMSGNPNKVEVIEYINKGEGLTKFYKKGLEESKHDIVVFCHDDIIVETKQFGKKIIRLFDKNPEYGIIGVAGTKFMSTSGRWWDDRSKMYGKVAHTHEGKTWLSSYSGGLGDGIEETIVVDGVFFSVNKTRIKEDFDLGVSGFHFYDVDFCFRNFLKGVKIGVHTNVRINHMSIGQTNQEWENNRITFAKKYKDNLPIDLENLTDSYINDEGKNKIKIITGWSDKGGSTFAFINLVNKLNDLGYDTTLYGPHDWHLDKCKSDLLKNYITEKSDTLMVHFLRLDSRPDCKKVIFNCHETNVFEIGQVKQFWDSVVFINEKQRKYHKQFNGKYESIPNLKEMLVKNGKSKDVEKIAGVVGSIDVNKQTHVSIMRALNEGYEKIYLFGNVTDQPYYDSEVKPLLNDNVIEYGFTKNKQEMYDMVNAMFLSSRREVAPLVKDECESTGTIFNGNFATNHDGEKLTNEEIMNRWVKVLGVKKPIVHAYFLCYNESNILPNLINYYSKFCEKIHIIDNHSTDNSKEIVESFVNTEFTTFDSEDGFNDKSNIEVKNNVWKQSRGVADYVILGDTDEFLYHENMNNFLIDSHRNGVTIFKPEGHHMIANEDFMLSTDEDLLDSVKEGVRTPVLDKPMMFDCNQINEINYGFGAHSANPTGKVTPLVDPSLKMLHYKFLGINDYLYKNKIRGERLSSFNKQHNFGTYYLASEEEIRKDYKLYLSKRVKLLK